MNDTTSEAQEHLRLISESTFEFCGYALKKRIPRKYQQARQQENEQVPANATKASVFGASLLSGLLYCAHCGKKMVSGYWTKQQKNGAYHRPVYRCYNGSVKAKECDGQTVYSAAKIEAAVLEVVRSYFRGFSQPIDTIWREQARQQMRSKQGNAVNTAQTHLDKLKKTAG